MVTELPDRVGGRLALDFVNTVDPRHGPGRREFLTSYGDLLAWAEPLGADLPHELSALRRAAAEDPGRAQLAFDRAMHLREALYRVFAAALARRAVADDDLAVVNALLGDATDHHVLVPAVGGGIRDGWADAAALDSMLWPVVIDAWDLLTTADIDRVRECPGDGTCGWLFLDTSRSGTRRWCDMRTCGNRAKVRTHYARGHHPAAP
jgi:predicted RNA-binding Zn ribbon-like protein